MPFIYILKSISTNNWYYVGSCNILENRLKQHKKGSVRSTKSRRPLEFIYSKEFKTIREARQYENFLKSPAGYLSKKKIIEDVESKPR